MSEVYRVERAAGGLVLIRWGHACDAHGCVQGDCFVVVRERGESDETSREYDMEQMTLVQIHDYIAANPHLLGSMIRDCRGIVRGEKVFLFENPICVRNAE